MDDPRILFRYDALIRFFDEFISEMGMEGKVFLNNHLLYVAVESYFQDIDRFKSYVETDFSDNHKRAAYTIKWISKIKPIQINFVEDISIAELLCNAFFAVVAGLNLLEINIHGLSENYFCNLLYICQYRDINAINFASEMYVVEHALNQSQI